jgi:hypothetical protein
MLEDEIKGFLNDRRSGIPWVLRMQTGEGDVRSTDDVSDAELLHGLQIQITALNEAVLMLARAIDELSHDEPS